MAGDGSNTPNVGKLGAAVEGLVEGQKVFGRYTLMKIVGHGRASVVWLAWDEKNDRDAALKFLPEMTRQDPSAVAIFKREIRKLQEQLRHPAIVPISDLEQEGTVVAMVSEFVEGKTLTELREQKDSHVFAPQELADWVQQLCSCLIYAHSEARVAFGNLKPTNLIVSQKGPLRITDFGLQGHLQEFFARVLDTPPVRDLPYLSPQALAEEPANPLDDVYALGASLYELMTSRPPFYTGDLALQVKSKVPPPMTHRRKELRVIGEPISRLWEETVGVCLSKDAGSRPQTMSEVVQKLELEAPPSVDVQELRPAPQPAASSNTKIVVGAAIAFILLLGVVVFLLGRGGNNQPVASGTNGPVVSQGPSKELQAAEKARLDAEKARKDAEKARKDAEAKIAAAEAKSKQLAMEVEQQKLAEAKLRAQAEEDRRLAEANRLKAEQEAKRQAEEVEKARMTEKNATSDQARLEAEKARKDAEEKAAKLQAQLEALKQAEAKRAADAEKMQISAEQKRKQAAEEAAALAAEAKRQQAYALALEQQRQAAEAKAKADAKAKAEAEAKAQADALAQARLTPGKPWVNSLGMRFVPVGDIMVGIWECRVSDFDAFVTATRYDAGQIWKSPGFTQGDSFPVVNVSWQDAQAFCKWLTERERKATYLGDYSYRLPTDLEWSKIAQLEGETGATPADRDSRVKGIYPWGTTWPPPIGAGNYDDRVTFDGFDGTAPVASFRPNRYGIYDLGGNAWEWCQDWGDSSQSGRVLRGGSWLGYIPGSLLTSYRRYAPPTDRHNDQGFRVIISK